MLILAVLGPCAACSGDGEDARVTLSRFHTALSAGAASEVCATLSPSARSELTSTTGTSCEESVARQLRPEQGPWVVEVFGDQAIGRHGDRATFLSRYAEGWRVTAVGCSETGRRDFFDCTLQGS